MYNRQFTWGNFDAWTLLPWLAPNLKGRLKFVAQLISSFVWQGHAGDVEWTRCWCCNMDCQSAESQGFLYGLPRLPCNHWLCTTWFSLELTNIPLRNSSQFVVKWTQLLFIFSSLYSLIFFSMNYILVSVIHLTCLLACNSFVEQGGIKLACLRLTVAGDEWKKWVSERKKQGRAKSSLLFLSLAFFSLTQL